MFLTLIITLVGCPAISATQPVMSAPDQQGASTYWPWRIHAAIAEHTGNATDHRPSSNCLKAFTFDDGGLSGFIGAQSGPRADLQTPQTTGNAPALTNLWM